MKFIPFHDGKTGDAFKSITSKIIEEIKTFDNERFLGSSATELEESFVAKVTIEPLIFHLDHLEGDRKSMKKDVSDEFRRRFVRDEQAFVPGTCVTVSIPFEGDPELWRLQPSTFGLNYPEVTVSDNKFSFDVTFADDNADANKTQGEIDGAIKALSAGVGHVNSDIERHNREAPDEIRRQLGFKRKYAENALGVVGKLSIPMRRRAELLPFVPPMQRKPSPIRPTITQGNYEPEYALAEEEYQNILKILRSASLVMERCPDAFETIGEEAIRMTFLVLLNGHYEGQATGETFNSAGKTDIIVRWENRNVFIAECKFWTGPVGFNGTIDQILNYLTWRDTKCALLIFNTNKDSAGVREKMHDVMQARSEFRKVVSYDKNGDGRYVLVKPTEPGGEIIVTTQLYDIPRTAEEKPIRERRMRNK